MDMEFLLKGIAIGFSIAAPVGPIGILCIRRTVSDGRLFGLASGLGAATADAIYGCIAGFGLTAVSDLILGQQIMLRLLGGIVLLYLGIKTWMALPSLDQAEIKRKGMAGAYLSTFLLTITNPMTILSFGAVFAGLGLAEAGSYKDSALTVAGVFLGSAVWWLILSTGVGLFREKLEKRGLHWVNKLSGLVISGFGLAALFTVVYNMAA